MPQNPRIHLKSSVHHVKSKQIVIVNTFIVMLQNARIHLLSSVHDAKRKQEIKQESTRARRGNL
jgi:hypothetical protein